MFTDWVGVYLLDDISETNIERTLIDVSVRPASAGGADSVLDIYQRSTK